MSDEAEWYYIQQKFHLYSDLGPQEIPSESCAAFLLLLLALLSPPQHVCLIFMPLNHLC